MDCLFIIWEEENHSEVGTGDSGHFDYFQNDTVSPV